MAKKLLLQIGPDCEVQGAGGHYYASVAGIKQIESWSRAEREFRYVEVMAGSTEIAELEAQARELPDAVLTFVLADAYEA